MINAAEAYKNSQLFGLKKAQLFWEELVDLKIQKASLEGLRQVEFEVNLSLKEVQDLIDFSNLVLGKDDMYFNIDASQDDQNRVIKLIVKW